MNTTSKSHNYNASKYFLVAFGILNILAFTLFFCGLGFLVGLPVSKWQFPLACIVGLIVNYYAAIFFLGEKAKKHFFKNVCVIIGSFILFIAVAGCFYDVSFDGQWYHQETVYQLKQGYNPAYQTLAVPANEINDAENACNTTWPNTKVVEKAATPPLNLRYLNINNFAKGTEVIQAAIYQLTNRIETGKAVNFMLLLAAFFLCLSFLYQIKSISNRQKWILAILLAFNPLVIVQLLTFCVDGNLGCLILCLLAIACLIFKETNRYYLLLLVSIATLAINMKFTGLAYTAILGAGFIITLLVYKKTETFRKVLIVGLIAFTIGILCSGFNPYITNLIRKGHVFYGLDETKGAVVELTPPLLRGLNRVEKLMLSVLTHEGPFAADKTAVWHIPKIPFFTNRQDILESFDSEQSLSGFGPFFGGATIIAAIIFLIAIIRVRKTQAFGYTVAMFTGILITVLIIEDSWWARFVPQFWLLPVIILCLCTCLVIRGVKVLRGVLQVALGLNLVWTLFNIFFNMLSSERIDHQLQQLKTFKEPIAVEYSTCKGFRSNRIRFAEAGILTVEKKVNGKNVLSILESSTKIETTGKLPVLPKPFILVLNEKLFGGLFLERSF